jgi:hypothetical protein
MSKFDEWDARIARGHAPNAGRLWHPHPNATLFDYCACRRAPGLPLWRSGDFGTSPLLLGSSRTSICLPVFTTWGVGRKEQEGSEINAASESLLRHRSDRSKLWRVHMTLRSTADVFPRFSSIRCAAPLSVLSPARSTLRASLALSLRRMSAERTAFDVRQNHVATPPAQIEDKLVMHEGHCVPEDARARRMVSLTPPLVAITGNELPPCCHQSGPSRRPREHTEAVTAA